MGRMRWHGTPERHSNYDITGDVEENSKGGQVIEEVSSNPRNLSLLRLPSADTTLRCYGKLGGDRMAAQEKHLNGNRSQLLDINRLFVPAAAMTNQRG